MGQRLELEVIYRATHTRCILMLTVISSKSHTLKHKIHMHTQYQYAKEKEMLLLMLVLKDTERNYLKGLVHF